VRNALGASFALAIAWAIELAIEFAIAFAMLRLCLLSVPADCRGCKFQAISPSDDPLVAD
jgi:hypothetical protein